MMILPSLAKHASSEDVDNSGGAADQVTANSVTEKDVTDDHTTADSSAVALQEAQTSDSDVNATLSASHTPHGSSSHLVPSHHLSTLSHPQVHYIPSVSMPTISSGSNGQPTHSNAPTPALPVTFMPEVIKGTYGELHVDANGQYTFVLNPNSPQYILLNQHQPGTDHFALHLSNGSSIIVQIPVTGKQDTPSISGDLTGVVTEDHNIDSQGLLHANGKIDVIDPDQNESSVKPEVISGKYGSLTIDADGHWQYQVDNSLSNVQALTAATSLHESFTIHTKDGTPQTIDMTIGGNDDNAVVTGMDKGSVTEESQLQTSGTLSVIDADTGEAHFSNTDIVGSFGTLHLTDSGKWTYDLDNTNPAVQALGQGSNTTDTITVHSADGTAHQVTVTINGTNDKPVLNHISSQTVNEGDPQITGQISSTDIDHGDTATYSSPLTQPGFTLNPDGSYVIDPTDPSFNHLAVGEHQTLIIPVIATDNNGGNSVSQNLIIRIDGTNDKPVLNHISSQTVNEGDPQITGQITSTDIDHGDTATYSSPLTQPGFTLNPDGSYVIDPTDPSFNHLAVGEHQTLIIPVIATDNNGGNSVSQNLIIRIDGTNDKPVLNHISSQTVNEGDPQITGQITSTDIDHGDTATYSSPLTQPGFTLNPDGSYVIDPTDPSFNHLAVGEHQTLIIPVIATDNNGGNSVSHNLIIRIDGTNDEPVLNHISSQTVSEGDPQITGQITSTDIDHGDTATYSSPLTQPGFTLNPDGTYVIDPTDPSFNHLAVGEHQTLIIPVIATDNNGGNSVSQNLVIRIDGTNDKPVLNHINSQTVNEGDPKITGQITSTDVDHGDTATYSSPLTQPGFTLNPNGSYTIDPTDPSFNHLAVGEHQTLIIPVIATDNNGGNSVSQNLIIRIDGTNDAPVVSAATLLPVGTEDTLITLTSAQLLTHATDVDHNDIGHLSIANLTADHGSIVTNLDGTFSFTPDKDYNGQVQFNYDVKDTNGGITHTGATTTLAAVKDAAIIKGTDTGNITEDHHVGPSSAQTIAVSGSLTVTDPDAGQDHFRYTPLGEQAIHDPFHGSLHITPQGDWDYSVSNSALQHIHEGDADNVVYRVQSADGTSHFITITVTGTNDAPVLTAQTQSVIEDGSALQGQMQATDVDDNTVLSFAIANPVDGLTFNADGSYSFDPSNAAYQHLDAGQAKTITIPVTVKDEFNAKSTQNLTITVHGTNDAPTLAVTNLAANEDGLSVKGTALFTDVDATDTHAFTVSSMPSGEGSVSIDATTGEYTFTPGSDFQSLAEGAKQNVSFNVTVTDGTGATDVKPVTIIVTGTNDKPVLTVHDVDATEDGSAVKGQASFTDVDSDDVHTYSVSSMAAGEGSVSINPQTGEYTFTPGSDFQALADGAKQNVSFNVAVTDGTGATDVKPVTIIVTGTNDKPVLTVHDVDATEDGSAVKGQASFTDVDSGDVHTYSVSAMAAGEGTVSINPQTGEYTFNPGSDFQSLAEGATKDVTFDVTVTDGHGGTATQTVNVTVTGTNDKPIVSSWTQLPEGVEDKSVTIKAADLLTHAIDIDTSDILSVTHLQAEHGTLLDNKDGTYTYTPDKDYNGEVRLTYRVEDGHGGEVDSQARFNLAAVGDAAVITGDDKGDVSEHQNPNMSPDYAQPGMSKIWNNTLHESGQLSITDADAGEASFVTHGAGYGYHGQLGKLHITEHGFWSYVVDNTNSPSGRTIDALGAGETLTDTITVQSKDGTTHDIVITIHGDNDKPYCSSEVRFSNGREDTAQVLTLNQLLQNTVDVDTNDTGKLTIENLHADHGSIAINSDGTFTFTPTKDYNGPVHFTYDVKDAHGGVTHTGANLDLAAVADAAIITGQSTCDVDEGYGTFGDRSPDYAQTGMAKIGQGALTADGKLDIVDPDTGESQFDPKGGAWNNSYHGQYGHLLLNTDGTWHYDVTVGSVDWVNNRKTTIGTAIDKLGEGQTLTDTVTIQSKDGTTHDIVITIHGDNDKPYCSSEVQLNSGKEDSAQTLTTNDLLANTVDVDANDAGKLSIENLHADHGSVLDNHDGTFTFTPNSDYNGKVQFTYDVKDAHGGTTHTSATTTLAATPDKAVITDVTTESVTEDGVHASHNNGVTTELATGQLHVTDPDSGENKFQFSQFGETAVSDPFHGMLRIDRGGSWQYSVDNANLQHLAQGQTETVIYRVHSQDGTAYELHIDVIGTNDVPTVSQVVLSNGTEDTNYQIQASQFGFSDVDTGDTLHSVAITDIPPAAQGKFVLDGHDVVAGQDIAASDISKLQFVPAHDFNGDIQFKYTVNDGHVDSQEATNTLHINTTADPATIGGTDTGSVTEDSFSGMQWLIAKGQLTISDADAGEDKFDPMVHAQNNAGIGYDTKLGGHVLLSQDGSWQYNMDNFSTAVQKLAEGETAVDTVTIHSVDGTPHDIQITIHGTNDDPILSVTQTTPTTGTLTETDVDVKDTHSFSVVSPTGQFGDLSVDPTSGAYVYTPNSSVSGMSYNSAAHTYHGADVFEVKVADNHGGESSRFLTFDTNGQVNLITGQQPTITTTVPQNPIVTTAQPSLPTSSNTPPSNTVTVDLVASSDSGKSDTDNLTNDNTPTITGHTDIPYSQVTIYDGSTPIGHAVSDGSGQYSAVVTNLTDGDHNLSAKALAPSSVLPATSPLLSVHVDTTIAPLTIELTHDTGSNTVDLITNDGALTITGHEAGAIVEYSTDNGTHWSQSFTAAQGANTVTVRQTDSAGNVSPSSSLSFTLDNQVTAPSVSLRSDTSGQFHPTADLITQDARLSIQTEAGAQVEYSNDGGQSWSSMFNPIEGVNNLLVRQTDIAGNQSATTHFSFTLDTTPGTVSVNPISIDNALNAVENNQVLVITGTTSNIAAGDRVYLNFGNNHFREASVHSDGTWSLTVSASDHQRYFSADGNYPIKIGTVDLAGNATPEISTHLIVDTQSPIPHISVDSVTRDNIINLAESGQNIDITGHVSGDFNVGDAVSLSVNGATISALTGVVDSKGNYSISVPAQTLIKANIHSIYASGQQPVHSIEATVITTDQAGNIGSATTGTQAFSIDKIASANIQLDPVTADNVINAAESNHNVSITGHVSGDVQQGDTVNILVGQQTHTGIVDQNGQFSIDIAGSELTAQTAITATVDTTDNAGNPAHASQTLSYAVDTQVDMPTITFENPGSDNAYSKTEIAQGHAGTITATVHAAADAKIGEHLVVNGQDHVLDAHSIQNGLQVEVAPGSHVQVTMTDEHGNTAGSQGFAASAIPDPIIVKAPPGSHQVSGSLGTPPLLPSLTPVPTAQHGWRIHLPDGSYVTSHHGQYGTLTIDPQTGDLHYQEQANVHTGPHGSASGIGQHEDKFEVALQGTNQDEVVAHVNVQILSHGPGNSGKLNIGTEVVDMTITPITHTSHSAPPPPPPVLHDEPDMSSQADFTVTQSDDSYLDLTQHAHQAPDQKTSHHGAAAYLDALGIKPDTTSTVDHDQPADMDIVLAQVDQPDPATHDQAHLDMSDALEHHDANVNHNQDDEHHHHNDVDGLPDIDPNP